MVNIVHSYLLLSVHFSLAVTISKDLCNSIINKSPLSALTNRSIGGNPPSVYLKLIEEEKNIDADTLDKILETHLIDVDAIRSDDFNTFFEKRKDALYCKILEAMGQK